MAQEIKQSRVLVVEPAISEQRDLAHKLRTSGVSSDITLLPIASGVQELVSSGDFDLVFLGAGLGLSDHEEMLGAIQPLGRCGIIVICKDPSVEIAHALIDSGAHAILPFPFNERMLEDASREALRAISRALPARGALYEQITSLPWILQSVASRMEAIARGIELERNQGSLPPVASSKVIQEALLASLAATDSNVGVLTCRLIEMLRKS